MRADLIQLLNNLYEALDEEDYPIDFKLKERQLEFLIIINIRKEDVADILRGCLKARRIAGE